MKIFKISLTIKKNQMDIISELKYFYDLQADNFHETRKKFWPEFDIILKNFKNFDKPNIKILELGCGAWRFYWFLQKNLDKNFDYTWIDLSENLIKIAQNEYGEWNFKTSEMNKYMSNLKQQDFDIVLLIASFQHLPNFKERLLLLRNIYRILNYWWQVIMINWSFSKWFIKKYYKEILKWVWRSAITLGKYKFNDLFIPWKDKNTLFKRYYHIFLKSELKKLFLQSWFIVKNLNYIDKFWQEKKNFSGSRNSFIIWEKEVLY